MIFLFVAWCLSNAAYNPVVHPRTIFPLRRAGPWARRIWIPFRPPPPLVTLTTPRWDPRRGPTRRGRLRRCRRATSRTSHRTLHRNLQWFRSPAGGPFVRRARPAPAASVQPEVPDNLLEALNNTSIEEEHRTVMSAVIQKVQLAKSGLTEACSSLLTGFEVRVLKHVI